MGADVDATAGKAHGRTPLHYAAQEGHVKARAPHTASYPRRGIRTPASRMIRPAALPPRKTLNAAPPFPRQQGCSRSAPAADEEFRAV